MSCFVSTIVAVGKCDFLYGKDRCKIKTYNNDEELLKMSFISFKMI